ncbi:MAG: hypothetical protein V1783_04525 [Bacteroidota bacterium]
MFLNNKHTWVLLIALFLIHSLKAQISICPNRFEQTVNFNQLNSSMVENLWGLQSKSNYLINDKIEVLNTATFLSGQKNNFYMNDFRLNFYGPEANQWYPGLSVEVGYLYMNRDFLELNGNTNQHGVLFGGDWNFPLKILSNGYVIAKWAYVIRLHSNNMTIFNCFVHWNLTKNIGFHVGGDIYTKFGGLKYSGFVAGISIQLLKRKTTTNKQDFIRHVVPRMKSPVALHPGTRPYSMHLPPLFVFHEQPHFRLVMWFLGYMLVLFLHIH